MRTLVIIALLLLPSCAGGRGAPLISITNVQPDADHDEIVVRRSVPQQRRYK